VFSPDLPVGERMICPFTHNYCQYLHCPLWDVEAKCCAILGISNSLQAIYNVLDENLSVIAGIRRLHSELKDA